MLQKLKNIPLLTAIFALFYLVLKNWFGIEIPAWSDISKEILTILTILFAM